MSRLSPIPRAGSRSSMRSNTTYHSFQEADVFDHHHQHHMLSPLASSGASAPKAVDDFEATPMRRQDSGYESLPPRSSKQRLTPASAAAAATNASASPAAAAYATGAARPRSTRPSARRSAKSGPVAHMPRAVPHPGTLYRSRSHAASTGYVHQLSQSPVTYFHFPAMPDPAEEADEARGGGGSFDFGAAASPATAQRPLPPPSSPPPQTTHYWTSDRTRRLEYAAIDAASRGVKGWVMRHLVPDCFVPKSKKSQHLAFDDDAGSVRRYRLDLDEDDVLCAAAAVAAASSPSSYSSAEKHKPNPGRRWRFWGAKTM